MVRHVAIKFQKFALTLIHLAQCHMHSQLYVGISLFRKYYIYTYIYIQLTTSYLVCSSKRAAYSTCLPVQGKAQSKSNDQYLTQIRMIISVRVATRIRVRVTLTHNHNSNSSSKAKSNPYLNLISNTSGLVSRFNPSYLVHSRQHVRRSGTLILSYTGSCSREVTLSSELYSNYTRTLQDKTSKTASNRKRKENWKIP